ncbi:hypothetical protein R3P38DRAFT_3095214 [Favolaschia claudopus]|uniref:Uncharacterized protein n=1 Tax=Favolaschia claudopus TaxID=2862362 RepID=A0AAV9ZR72_9AGAR
MAIVRFIVAKAGFGVPGRSSSSSEEFFEVRFPVADDHNAGGDSNTHTRRGEGEVVTLPLPYRLPLLWTAKYLWTSLHLVLTADPAIRVREWRETRFEMLHLARLIDVLLSRSPLPSSSPSDSKSPGKEDEALKTYRCPAFDRALRRFWHHWLISRDEFVRDFWREFGEEEFEDGDVLGLAWPRWVLKGHKGFLLTKAEVANGIPVEGFLRGFWVDEGRGEFGYPDVDGEQDKAVQPPESSELTKKGNGNDAVDVEGAGDGDQDTAKRKSKKKVFKKSKPVPLAQSPDDTSSPSAPLPHGTARKSSPVSLRLVFRIQIHWFLWRVSVLFCPGMSRFSVFADDVETGKGCEFDGY